MLKLLPIFLLATSLSAQSPHFEVASIRPSLATANAGTSVNLFEGGRIRIENEPAKLLIRMAFQLQNSQISGGPEWLDTDRFDIEAKTGLPEKIQPRQMSPLMQSLLAERFHIQFHRETRELTVSALIIGKGGPKLKPQSEGESSATNTSGGSGKSHLAATATSMELLASYMGNRLGRIVIDKTGLSGGYDFTLDWTSDDHSDPSTPPLLTALHEQLGLRLESQKSPVEVLVIDRIEKPSENE